MNAMNDLFSGLKQWSDLQESFWTRAAAAPVPDSVQEFLPPWTPMAEDLLDRLLDGIEENDALRAQPEWLDLIRAGTVYRRLIAATWQQIQQDFEAHRIAVGSAPGHLPDWRELRDRWLSIAEIAFLRLLRSPEFLTAQRDTLRAYCTWFLRQPEDMRATVHLARTAHQTAQHQALGLAQVEIAQTPKTRIAEFGRTTVWRYHPLRPGGATLGPLLICYGLIGRQTMTDLLPGRSLVRNLLAMGVDVFVIDWGSAGPQDADQTLADYAIDHLGACIDATRTRAQADRITLMGICQGGTLALCHAAQATGTLNGLICAGTPVDFLADQHDPDPAHGLLNLWVRSMEDDDIRALIAAEGGLRGDLLGTIFNQLNPVRTLSRYLVDLPDVARDPGALNTFLAMETWLADRPNLPAALAETWLIDLYRGNALAEGSLTLNGAPVDLARIDVPVLNLVATGDHIIPPPCSTALAGALPPGACTQVTVPAGHIGMFVGSRAQTRTAPEIVDWLRKNT